MPSEASRCNQAISRDHNELGVLLQFERHIPKLICIFAHGDGRQVSHDIQRTADAKRQINDQIVGFDVDWPVIYRRQLPETDKRTTS